MSVYKQRILSEERGGKDASFMFLLHFVVILDLVHLREICVMKIYLCVLFQCLNENAKECVVQIVS